MSKTTCGCGCNTPPPTQNGCNCGCEESTVINFTTHEINQILADGIINCSVRYACCCGTIRPLSLSEAITLVPESSRTTTRILTFLSHDGRPEIWIYSGKTIMDWANPTYWTSIPTGETYSEIYSKISELELQLKDESINRANADADLRNRIDAIDGGENSEAFDKVNQKIDKEIIDREQADAALREYLFNLIQDTAKDFQDKLDEEAQKRHAEDELIREEISKINYDGLRKDFQDKLDEEAQKRHAEDERLEGLVKGLSDQIKASTPEGFQDLVDKVGIIETEVNTNKSDISDLSSKVSANKEEIDTISSQVGVIDTKVTLNETAVSNLTTKVDENKNDIDKVSNDLSTLGFEVKTNTSSISGLENIVTSVEEKVTSIETDITISKENITTLDGKLSNLEKKVDDLPGTDLSGLTQKVTGLETEVTQLSPKVESSETAIIELTAKVADNEASIAQLTNDTNNNTSSIESLDDRISDLEGREVTPPEGKSFVPSGSIEGIEIVKTAPVSRVNDNILYIVIPGPSKVTFTDETIRKISEWDNDVVAKNGVTTTPTLPAEVNKGGEVTLNFKPYTNTIVEGATYNSGMYLKDVKVNGKSISGYPLPEDMGPGAVKSVSVGIPISEDSEIDLDVGYQLLTLSLPGNGEKYTIDYESYDKDFTKRTAVNGYIDSTLGYYPATNLAVRVHPMPGRQITSIKFNGELYSNQTYPIKPTDFINWAQLWLFAANKDVTIEVEDEPLP